MSATLADPSDTEGAGEGPCVSKRGQFFDDPGSFSIAVAMGVEEVYVLLGAFDEVVVGEDREAG